MPMYEHQKLNIRNWPHPHISSTADFIDQHFPRFNLFWERFILDITDKFPPMPSWRNDTHESIEGIGMASFGILKSLNCIEHLKEKITLRDNYQNFKNSYYHLGLILDNIETLARHILICQDLLGIINLKDEISVELSEIEKKFKKWIDSYDEKIQVLISKGKPFSFYATKNSFTSIIISGNKEKGNYESIKNKIKEIRNLFTHNPSVDVFGNKTEFFIADMNNLDNGKYWSNLQILLDQKPEIRRNPISLITEHTILLFNNLNKVWDSFTINTSKVFDHPNVESLTKQYKR